MPKKTAKEKRIEEGQKDPLTEQDIAAAAREEQQRQTAAVTGRFTGLDVKTGETVPVIPKTTPISPQPVQQAGLFDLKQQAQARLGTEAIARDVLGQKIETKPVNIPTTEAISSKNKIEREQAQKEQDIRNQQLFSFTQIPKDVQGMTPTQAGLEGVKAIVTPAITTVAKIWDVIRSAVTMKNTKAVEIAQQGFMDTTTLLRETIEGVKVGQSPEMAIRAMELAQSKIDELQYLTTHEGKINLRYWLTKGKELETEILKEQAILQQLRNDLVIATQQRGTAMAQLQAAATI